jgi:hypothetical protein
MSYQHNAVCIELTLCDSRGMANTRLDSNDKLNEEFWNLYSSRKIENKDRDFVDVMFLYFYFIA